MNVDRFKFRAHNIADHASWTYSHPETKKSNESYNSYHQFWNLICKQRPLWWDNNNPEDDYGKIDKEWVVMQCTGFKDQKGELIFEGDILSVRSRRLEHTCEGPFIELSPAKEHKIQKYERAKKCNCKNKVIEKIIVVQHLIGYEGDGNPCSGFIIETDTIFGLEEARIIGNIYDNPELIKKNTIS